MFPRRLGRKGGIITRLNRHYLLVLLCGIAALLYALNYRLVDHSSVQERERDKVIKKLASKYKSTTPFSLQLLVDERKPDCGLKPKRKKESADPVVTYVCVARTGSGTLKWVMDSAKKTRNNVIVHHNHDCTLRDLEERGADRIMVTLRHPAARISSGVSRRIAGKPHPAGSKESKWANQLFSEAFVGQGRGGKTVAEAYVSALRNVTDPLHGTALEVTVGPRKQNYMVPVMEYYLEGPLGRAEVTFLCMETFVDGYKDAFLRWWGWVPPDGLHRHISKKSSHESAFVLSQFSKESLAWIEETYAEDIALYKKHCPEGFRAWNR